MQMKDKIYRNNHSKAFYYFKKIGIYSGAAVGAFILFAIPVSIIRAIVAEPVVEKEAENKLSETNNHDELLRF